MRARPLLASFAVTTLACMHGGAASHGAQAAATTAAPPSTAGAGMGAMCPMEVPGTTVTPADTSDGEALTFTTASADQVPALRERVRAMAAMHNQHHAETGGSHGMHHGGMAGHGAGSGHDMGAAMPPPSRARVEDVDGGARLVVTPRDPADVGRLQSTVRAHAERLQREGCGMMGAGPHH